MNTASLNIDSLGQELQNFVVKYEQGATRASDLVSKEALQMRELVVRETRKAELAVSAHVTQTSAKFEQKFDNHLEQASRERLRERLLRSLKYPGMNDRANQIEVAHASTFRWLFADGDDGSDRSDTDPSKPPEHAWSSFTDWLQSNLSMYWIMGKPGSGKSTLAKFILSEPRTKATLKMWRPGAIIARHYFWRPGGPMQRNIKGMLCSIIYQLVLSIPNALEYASSNVAGPSEKDDDTDWSVPELERLCLGLIKHCGTPLCLFIDGLDECGPEDSHQKLLDTLDRIRSPNVKIIASSRNEPIFEKRFRHEPQLRVQDLTAEDLCTYTTEMLLYDIEDEIRWRLVARAEGVFLWLVLAVQSINRGLSNGDSLSDLDKRIESLPRGLNDLYKDMWERLNDDSDIYRESAALYFKLAMAYQDSPTSRRIQWTPLEMMLASFATSHIAFARPTLVSASQLLKECEEFHKRVEVRCAGFLGLYGKSTHDPLKEYLGDEERALLAYADIGSTFQFIHRSARDFLVDTVEGQNILRHDNTPSEDIKIRCIRASLRALELLDPILGDAAQIWYFRGGYDRRSLEVYLEDLSRLGNASDSAVRELIARCYELCYSSILTVNLVDKRPERRAAFFATAVKYPNLTRHCISIIETQLVGSDIKSAILSSVTTTYQHQDLKLVRRLLSLPDVDVNRKCPLVAPRGIRASCNPDDISPLDHIKESPLNSLLGSALERMDWRFAERAWHRNQFLGLVSDFALQGADIHSTLFLAIPLDYPPGVCTSEKWTELDRIMNHRGLLPFAGRHLFKWAILHDRTYDGVLCVVALQATTVIQRMLASWPMTSTGHNSLNEDGYSLIEDEYSASELETARQLLSQRCQEDGSGANDRVVGFLQPCGHLRDMPYRRVSDQDSAQIMDMVLQVIFEDNPRRDDLEAACREVLTRTPFSSIGFRDYMKNMGCFDDIAAQKLLLEYRNGMIQPLTACPFNVGSS